MLLGFLLHFAPDSWEDAVCRGVIRLPFVGKALMLVVWEKSLHKQESGNILHIIEIHFPT